MMQLFQDQLLQLVGSFTLLGIDAGLGQQGLGADLACVSNNRRLTFSAVRIPCGDEGESAVSALSKSWSILSMTRSRCGLGPEIHAAQDDAGGGALKLPGLEFF